MTPVGRARVLIVANYALPENDHRVAYAAHSKRADVWFAVPERPAGVRTERFRRFDIREGFRWRYVAELWRLFKTLKTDSAQFDMVHYYSTLLCLVGPIIAWCAGRRCMITVTGLGRTADDPRWRYRVLQPVYWAFMGVSVRLSQRVLFQNLTHMLLFTERFHRHAGTFKWIGSTVARHRPMDTVCADPPTAPATSTLPAVVCVARLIQAKGILEVLAVAEQLHETVRFHVVGAPDNNELQIWQAVKEAADRRVITYHGQLPHHDVMTLYGECQFLLFLSQGEGMPRVVLEAIHEGLIPIVSDIAAHRELVSHDKLRVPVNDANAAAALLTRLYNDLPGTQQWFREQLYPQVLERFSVESYVQRLDRLTDAVADSGR